MVFNSLTFLLFLAILLALYHAPLPWRGRKGILLGASYLFYAAWSPPFVLLLWLSTVVDFVAGGRLGREQRHSRRLAWLGLSLGANLGLLGFFKYGGFLTENTQTLLALAGVRWQAPAWDIVLPVGISFYTFQTLSYTIDVWRRRLEPSTSLLDFSLYVTFFPQLVAGPIVRAVDFLPQLAAPRRSNAATFGWGLFLLTLGLFQKVVVADNLLAPTADTVFAATGAVDTIDAWWGTMAFSGQIFADFAGYSTCAIGVALCLGFHLPDNFLRPYGAIGFSDFWRRWHITLSSWLRDYLYIPLGGNRSGAIRTLINLVIVMALGGLWHGAAWTFVLWGLIHGGYLVVEHLLRQRWGGAGWTRAALTRIGLVLLTYVLVLVSWVPFRAGSLDQTGDFFLAMLGLGPAASPLIPGRELLVVGGVTVVLLLVHGGLRSHGNEAVLARLPSWAVVGLWSGMLMSLMLAQGGSDAFIYFQF